MEVIFNRRISGFFISYMASLFSVMCIFLVTMFFHYQHFDLSYFLFALVRVLFISIAPGVLGTIFYMRSKKPLILIGAIAGPLFASVFVVLTMT